MLDIRQAVMADLPAIWAIVDDHQAQFMDDYTRVTKHNLARMVSESPDVYVITAQDYPVGLLWLSHACHDLHITLHLLLRPAYFREFLTQRLGFRILDFVFDHYRVKKVRVECMQTQSTAMKLLLKFGFTQRGCFWNHTRYAGRKVNVLVFELTHYFWRWLKTHENAYQMPPVPKPSRTARDKPTHRAVLTPHDPPLREVENAPEK